MLFDNFIYKYMLLNNTNIITYISLLRSTLVMFTYAAYVNITREDMRKEIYFIMIFMLFKGTGFREHIKNKRFVVIKGG